MKSFLLNHRFVILMAAAAVCAILGVDAIGYTVGLVVLGVAVVLLVLGLVFLPAAYRADEQKLVLQYVLRKNREISWQQITRVEMEYGSMRRRAVIKWDSYGLHWEPKGYACINKNETTLHWLRTYWPGELHDWKEDDKAIAKARKSMKRR